MTIPRFNHIRDEIRACNSSEEIDALRPVFSGEVQAAFVDKATRALAVIIRNLAAYQRRHVCEVAA